MKKYPFYFDQEDDTVPESPFPEFYNQKIQKATDEVHSRVVEAIQNTGAYVAERESSQLYNVIANIFHENARVIHLIWKDEE